MSKSNGWTLLEAMVVLAVLVTLTGILLPSVSAARDRARQISCAGGMHDIHQALITHAMANEFHLPPFAISDLSRCDIVLSGHWGGISQKWDPALWYRNPKGEDLSVNLWSLVAERSIDPDRLVCPAAPSELKPDSASYFPFSSKFSSYCLRFPWSEQVFRTAESLAYSDGQHLLNVYTMLEGGCSVSFGGGVGSRQVVPRIRIDRRYRTAGEAQDTTNGDGVYDVARDTMLSDGFWHQDLDQPAPSHPNAKTYRQRAWWSHGQQFNVLSGNGAVHAVEDDRDVVRANSNAPGKSLADDGLYYASYAERVWQFFDSAN